MEENRYTDLDNIFKDRLNKASQQDATWNVPADDVFDAAISQVNDQRRRRFTIFWLFGGLLVAAIIAAFLFTAQKVEKLEKALAQSQAQLTESQAVVAELHKQNEIPVTNENAEIPTMLASDDKVIQNLIETQSSPVLRSSIRDQMILMPERKNAVVDAKLGMKTLDSNLDKEYSVPTLERRANSSVAALPLVIWTLENNSEVQISNPINTAEQVERGQHAWYLGATSNWTTLEMKGIEESSAMLTEYDQRYLGYSIRAGVVQALSGRWSIDYRFAYQKFTNKSAFMDDLVYDDRLETIDVNGNTTYSMDLSILSPMSNLKKDLEFQVDGFSIVDNDVFENITRISEEYSWYTMAVIPKFDLIKSDKWSANAGLGLQTNYLLKMQEDMDVKLYFESEMMKNEIIQSDPSDNVNPWSFSAIGEVTLSHEMTERSSVSLTAGMLHSITPINTPSKGVAPRTYVNDVQVGLNFNFKI